MFRQSLKPSDTTQLPFMSSLRSEISEYLNNNLEEDMPGGPVPSVGLLKQGRSQQSISKSEKESVILKESECECQMLTIVGTTKLEF